MAGVTKLALQNLVKGMEKTYKHYNGWTLYWEHPGYFSYSRARTDITFLPDNNEPFICVSKVVNNKQVSEYEILYTGMLIPKKLFELLKLDLPTRRK